MIYTVTFNPSLDYIIRVDDFRTGQINRTAREMILPGGKGVNVSIVLSNLGHKSIALGFTAGIIGEDLEGLLQKRSQHGFYPCEERLFQDQCQNALRYRDRDQRSGAGH